VELYLLTARDNIPNSPWEPWYDRTFSFVVRAESAENARKIAAENAGAEGAEAWLNEKLSGCDVLSSWGEPGVIIEDNRRA